MARAKNFAWSPDDPQARALDDLDDRPERPAARSQRKAPAPARTYDGFPPCPPERTERTWRLVRQFVETGEANGRVRMVSPWQLAEDLVTRIKHDQKIWAFSREHGNDLTEDLLGRMIRIYWDSYVTSTMTRTQIVNEYLDEYWSDLWEQARTDYATDEILRLEAAGELKTVPAPQWHTLANDNDFQAAVADGAVEDWAKAELLNQSNNLNPDDPNSNPDPGSESGSGMETGRGPRRRKDAR